MIGYLLDGQHRRVGRTVNGVRTHGWLWQSQLAPVAELDAAGAVVSRFVYATRPNVPDYLIKGDSTYRLVLDHLGSVRLVVNVATGSVAQRLDYDEYGRVLSNSNSGFQPFGFAGGLVDDATGLTRFGARDYDPETGTWTAKDPVGFAGGYANLYEYVDNDPLNMRDPSGLQGIGFVGGGSVAVSAPTPFSPYGVTATASGGVGYFAGSGAGAFVTLPPESGQRNIGGSRPAGRPGGPDGEATQAHR